jgi:hypothetical protein
MNLLTFQKWLYSKKNVVGCATAMIAILLYVGGIIDAFAWAIIAGFYVAGYMVAPKEKTTVFFHFANESLGDYRGFLDRLYKNSAEQLPTQAQERLNSIRINAHELLDFLDKSPEHLTSFNTNLHTIKKIFDQYLPNLVNRYIKLPKRYAETVVLSNKKTTKDMLMEQLTILDEQVVKIAHAIYENDTMALQTHGKLLEQKFEKEDYFEIEKAMEA